MFHMACFKRNPFEKIFLLMTIAGYPMEFPDKSENCKDKRSKTLKTYTLVLNILKFVSFLVSIVTLYQFINSWSMLLTVYALAIVGFAMSCFLQSRRTDIVKVVNRLCALYRSLKRDGDMGNKHLDWIILVYLVLTTFFCVTMSVFTLHYSFNEFRSRMNPPPFLKTYIGDKACTWLASFSIILTHSTSVSACGMSLILCDATFRVASEIIRAYSDSLRRSLKTRALDSLSSISADIATLRSISVRVSEVDRVLNVFTLLLYGLFFITIFLMISAGVSNEERFKSKMVVSAGVCVAVGAVSFFSMVTLSGARVQEEGERLKTIGLLCTDGIATSSASVKSECKAMLTLMLLLETIKETNLVVTGGGMFVIERKLFLTLGGTMVTYGVILFQMNQV